MSKIKAFFQGFNKKVRSVDIYGNSKVFFMVPLVIVLIMIICGCLYQFTNTKFDKFANIGVDFQGGTLLTAEFSEAGMNKGDNYENNLNLIKEVLGDKGLTVSIDQSSGESSIIVRYLNVASVDGQLVDYSVDEKVVEMNNLNDDIIEQIKAKVSEKYEGQVTVKPTATLIGNSASIKLLRTALISVSIALALMLIYIVIRFDIYSALAAIVALLHDIIIMMAFTVIFYVEIGSTIVAAVITIVAYSINNTIVVFDRIRSNLKPYKSSGGKYDFKNIINSSIFGTMTRTLYTTFTTLVVVVLLAALGVASIQTFALPIIFGLIAGFYSSVFLAAPLWGTFKELGGKIKNKNSNKKFKKEKTARA